MEFTHQQFQVDAKNSEIEGQGPDEGAVVPLKEFGREAVGFTAGRFVR